MIIGKALAAGKTLREYSEGRDNNYQLIRFVAASAVLVSHSYPLTVGAAAVQPLQEVYGFTLGSLAVYAFFFMSGLLVAQSSQRSASTARFFLARILRIFPGLAVVVLLTALILGPLVSSLSPGNYFSQPETYSYILRNISLVSLQYSIPSVFEGNIYGSAINGSLWTLPLEVACYIGLGAVAAAGMLKNHRNFWISMAAYAAIWALYFLLPEDSGLTARLGKLLELSAFFVAGAGALIYQDRIKLNLWIFLLAAVVVFFLDNTVEYQRLLLPIFLGYVLLYLAYVPDGVSRHFNRVGDYSYGIYIYAFPVQQSFVYLYPGIDTILLMASAFLITLALAVASWHVIEKPALGLRKSPLLGYRGPSAR